MKKNLFVAAALAVGLAGCAGLITDGKGPNPANPKVTVASGRYIVVDQEPIVIPKGAKNFAITWELPITTGVTFPDDGIVITDGGDQFKCSREAGRTRFTCIASNTRSGRYKYTIKVMEGEKALPPLDPIIINDN